MARPRVPLHIKNPAQNPLNNFAAGPRSHVPFPSTGSANTAQNPMFGRPIWTYVTRDSSPVAGPQPRLAKGTGHTGNPSLPGNAPQLPGYLSDNDYFPSTFDYAPRHDPTFERRLPRTINIGTNGREIVGTYQPHDFTPADRWIGQQRQATNWQVMEYPPDFRNLIAWQQVMKYRIASMTISARPLNTNNYFLGYQINPDIAATIGQSGLGSMGSQ